MIDIVYFYLAVSISVVWFFWAWAAHHKAIKIKKQLEVKSFEQSKELIWLKHKNRNQSKRIAELIELCDKLQPDLVEEKFDSLKFIRDCYNKANPQPNDGKVWISETEKIDFKGLVEKLNTYTDKAFYNSQKQE